MPSSNKKSKTNPVASILKVLASIALGCVIFFSTVMVIVGFTEILPESESLFQAVVCVILCFFFISLSIACVFLIRLMFKNIFKNIIKVSTITLKAFLVILLLFVLFGIIGALTPSPDTTSATVLINLLFGAVCLILKKFNFKHSYLLFICFFAVNAVISILAQNNIPEFIRAIKGKDFLGIWFGFTFAVIFSKTPSKKYTLKTAHSRLYAAKQLLPSVQNVCTNLCAEAAQKFKATQNTEIFAMLIRLVR